MDGLLKAKASEAGCIAVVSSRLLQGMSSKRHVVACKQLAEKLAFQRSIMDDIPCVVT